MRKETLIQARHTSIRRTPAPAPSESLWPSESIQSANYRNSDYGFAALPDLQFVPLETVPTRSMQRRVDNRVSILKSFRSTIFVLGARW